MKKRTFLVNKIVRDKSKELFVKEGTGAEIKTIELSLEDKKRFFKEKLKEEVFEVINVPDDLLLRAELADLLQVVYGFAYTLDGTVDRVEELRQTKLRKKGDFSTALFVESVTLGNDHPFIHSYLSDPKKYPEIIDKD